jgi:hypothetical protein
MKSRKITLSGATLIEMMIAVALLSLLMVMLAKILTTESRILRIQAEQIAVNQSAMRTVVRLKRDLSESSLYGINLIDPATNPSVMGIIFSSPRIPVNNAPGGVVYNTTDEEMYGVPLWQSYMCYYLAQDPQDSSKKC